MSSFPLHGFFHSARTTLTISVIVFRPNGPIVRSATILYAILVGGTGCGVRHWGCGYVGGVRVGVWRVEGAAEIVAAAMRGAVIWAGRWSNFLFGKYKG